MKFTVDTDAQTLRYEESGEERVTNLYSKDAFERLSDAWVKVGWALKYSYSFTWMGRPIIQLPEDMLRTQEVMYRVKPDLIIETGIAHGGSLVFYASLCKMMGKGRVVGVDIDIRPANRAAIEKHEMFERISLVQGSSTEQATLEQVRSHVRPGDRVMVILDSNHSKQHVTDELDAYHELVSEGSYIVATDGIMKDLYDLPGISREWSWDHPTAAAAEFAERHPEFVLEQPPRIHTETELTKDVTYWPGAWLRRK